MARYERVEGPSSKFWEVEVSGNDLTVNFGRIGTAGQSKTKSFADPAAAAKERDKLIKEKTGKGYALVGAAPSAAVASVQRVKPAPISKPAPTADVATVAGDAATAIVWPSGGFQWKSAWRQELPVVRGIYVPPAWPGMQLFSDWIVLPDDAYGFRQQLLDTLAAGAGCAWTYWGESVSRQRITREAVSKPDFAFWRELLAQVSVGDDNDIRWVLFHCVSLHGLAFAMEVVFAVPWLLQTAKYYWSRSDSGVSALLRHAIACADKTAYQEAYLLAERLRQQDAQNRLVCAYLFPHISQWAIECVEQSLRDPPRLMLSCTLPVQQFVHCIKDQGSLIHFSPLAATAY